MARSACDCRVRRCCCAESATWRRLRLDILDTWGDPYYVGLSALQLFDAEGAPIAPAEVSLLLLCSELE